MQYIYQILNLKTGKFYVGRTKSYKSRFSTHKGRLNKDKHDNIHLQRAWNLDKDCFEFNVLMEINTGSAEKDLILVKKYEQEFLNLYLPLGVLYNISPSSETGVLEGEKHPHYGKHPSDWMGEAYNIAIEKRDFSGDKNPFYGKHHSEKTLAVLKEKCSLPGEKNGFYGKEHSQKTKQRISESRKGLTAGAKNPAARRVSVDGIIYPTVKDAYTSLGISHVQMWKRLKSDKYSNYFYVT